MSWEQHDTQQAISRGAQSNYLGCEIAAITLQQNQTLVSKQMSHFFSSFLSSHGHVKLHFGIDTDKAFTGLQLFLPRAVKPILTFPVDGKTRASWIKIQPHQPISNFNIYYTLIHQRNRKALLFLEYYLNYFSL